MTGPRIPPEHGWRVQHLKRWIARLERRVKIAQWLEEDNVKKPYVWHMRTGFAVAKLQELREELAQLTGQPQ